MSYFSNINIDREQNGGILVACTTFEDNYNFETFLLTKDFETIDFAETFQIHDDRINSLVYFNDCYWTYGDDFCINRIAIKEN